MPKGMHLTSRELEILHELSQGFHNKEIAEHLCLTEGTVEQHLKRIYKKLGVTNRVEATLHHVKEIEKSYRESDIEMEAE